MPLNGAQLALLSACVQANQKLIRATGGRDGALAARDDLIRQAIEGGVSETAIATELDISRALVWKIKNALTIQTTPKKRAKRTKRTKKP